MIRRFFTLLLLLSSLLCAEEQEPFPVEYDSYAMTTGDLHTEVHQELLKDSDYVQMADGPYHRAMAWSHSIVKSILKAEVRRMVEKLAGPRPETYSDEWNNEQRLWRSQDAWEEFLELNSDYVYSREQCQMACVYALEQDCKLLAQRIDYLKDEYYFQFMPEIQPKHLLGRWENETGEGGKSTWVFYNYGDNWIYTIKQGDEIIDRGRYTTGRSNDSFSSNLFLFSERNGGNVDHYAMIRERQTQECDPNVLVLGIYRGHPDAGWAEYVKCSEESCS